MAALRHERHGNGVIVVASILIVAGVCALIGNLVGARYGGELVVVGIGLVFLTAHAATRRYGFLVPGAILSGVGAGIVLSDAMGTADNGASVVVAGGLGFLAIYFIDLLVTRHSARWWPVIPGGLMMLAGAATFTDTTWGSQVAQIGVPVVLIALGLILLFARGRTAGGQG